MSEAFRSRELQPTDRDAIAIIVDLASRDDALLLKRHFANFEDFPGWWYGTFAAEGGLQAVMAIEGHTGHLYATSDEAAEAMGRAMLRQQQMLGGRGSTRHELIGPWAAMTAFWRGFKAIDRQLKSDVARVLISSTGSTQSPSRRVDLSLADEGDLRLVVEFSALLAVEQQGHDPRRTTPDSHKRRCRRAIAEGRQLVAREAGTRPLMVAEVLDLDADAALLEGVFVPLPFRSRKLLVAGALALAASSEPVAGRRLLLFAEDELLLVAAERAGFEQLARYRHIVMVG